MTNETATIFDVANSDNVKSTTTDPHRPKDFLDPTEIKLFLDAAKAGRQGVRDHLLFLMMYRQVHRVVMRSGFKFKWKDLRSSIVETRIILRLSRSLCLKSTTHGRETTGSRSR